MPSVSYVSLAIVYLPRVELDIFREILWIRACRLKDVSLALHLDCFDSDIILQHRKNETETSATRGSSQFSRPGERALYAVRLRRSFNFSEFEADAAVSLSPQ